jgi:ADP-ribosylglycohydrolase
VAEQIGAQIFIDGWALVAPGDPELAADLARRAASVSHDGAAIHGAQLLAAMEAAAFVESDLTPGTTQGVAWRVSDTDGAPIAEVGVELHAPDAAPGSVYLDYLT